MAHTTYPSPKKTFPSLQLQTSNTDRDAVSGVVLAINNTMNDIIWYYKQLIPHLNRVQRLPAAYGMNNSANNSAEFLARTHALKILPQHIPTIII